jgi:hypothetical protein
MKVMPKWFFHWNNVVQVREVSFFCNTCIWVLRSSLIVPFKSPKVNKSNVVAIPSFVPLQYHFRQLQHWLEC